MEKRVRYIGTTLDQVRWGGNDDPRHCLTEGAIYTIVKQEEHSWHTKVILKEYPDKKFNSISFIPVAVEHNGE